MSELIDNLTDAQAEKLSKFLGAPERPAGTMVYPELAGFLFAVSCAPEVIKPSEWMPAVFDDQDPNYQSEAELREIVGAMLSLYNFVSCEADNGKVQLPPSCPVHADPVANFDPAPLGQWAAGFGRGHAWIQDSWSAFIPDEMEEELNECIFVLSFFADRESAEEFFQAAMLDGISVIPEKNFLQFAARILPVFPAAMENYAAMGRAACESLMKLGLYDKAIADDPKPSRNDQCP